MVLYGKEGPESEYNTHWYLWLVNKGDEALDLSVENEEVYLSGSGSVMPGTGLFSVLYELDTVSETDIAVSLKWKKTNEEDYNEKNITEPFILPAKEGGLR